MRFLKFIVSSLVLFFIIMNSFSAGMTRDEKILEAKKHFSFAIQNKNNNNFEEAKVQFEKSLALYDSAYQVHYLYGDLLLKMGKKAEAKAAFEKALALNPEHFNSVSELAKIHYENGDYDSSLVMYENMYKLKPDSAELLASIAGLREYLGKNDEALNAYIKLIEEGYNSFDNLFKAAGLAYKQGDLEKASRYSGQALEKKPDDTQALTLAGKTNFEMGNLKPASVYYRKLAETDSTALNLYIKLEDIYRNLSDSENLIWTLERHYKLAPEDTKLLGELCDNLYSAGELDKGLIYVNKGLALNPKEGHFHILLGENYRLKGQKSKALTEYRLALSDEKWKSSAQKLISLIEKPESTEDKKEKEFFNRGKK